MILHLESPSLRSETAVYILNLVVPKITFCHSSSFFSRVHDISIMQKLHTVLSVSTCSLTISRTTFRRPRFILDSRKTTKTKSPFTLYRRPLAAGWHHTVPRGNHDKLTYESLPSYTHSTPLQLFLRFLVVLLCTSFCVSTSFHTRTTQSSG